MQIIFTEYFKKKYKKLDQKIKNNFKEKIKIITSLGLTHKSLRIHKLNGNLQFSFSLSINMNFRALFYKKDENNELILVFYKIGNHDIYK